MASTGDTSATKNRPASKAANNGPGSFSDLLNEFEAQATKLPAEPVPDPYAAVAYALGWSVGDALTCTSYQVFDHLVKVPLLDAPDQQWQLLVQQIRSRCGHLNDHLKNAKADLNLSKALEAAGNLLLDPPLGGESPPSAVNAAVGAKNDQVMNLHTGILSVLWSVASPLAKSYQLGHEMEEMCTAPLAAECTKVSALAQPAKGNDPAGPAAVAASVKAHSAELHRLLTALASKLPPNAAHATDNSLRLWQASLDIGGKEFPDDLLLQGRRWHDVLAGEVSGKDGLRLTDYVAAADSVAGKLWQTARQVAGRFKILLIVAFLIAVGGIALLFWDHRGAIGAGIATLLATFGLTWKGIGDIFGRAAANGEEKLWDAELDWAIAYRFTVLRHAPEDGKVKSQSKKLGMDKPTTEHMLRYNQWQRKWPDVLPS